MVGDDGSFGERVVEAVARLGPLCAGIDPSAELLAAWGLSDDGEGLEAFGSICVEAFAGVVPVVKPQVAFFERHGSAGFAALERLIARARQAGVLVIADAKRGDIGSTSAAYAQAWLGRDGPLSVDAVTAVAYMGLGALEPLTRAAQRNGRGLFVVVRSSNPEGRPLQEAITATGPSVEDALLAEIAHLNAQEGLPIGSLGAVVGSTLRPSAFELSQLKGVFLTPGIGAQGASAADAARLFSGCRPGTVLPNVSRSVLAAGPSIEALRAAAITARDELAGALGAALG